jgi:hypothetical protein
VPVRKAYEQVIQAIGLANCIAAQQGGLMVEEKEAVNG